jgi:M18 family aminopeptidase
VAPSSPPGSTATSNSPASSPTPTAPPTSTKPHHCSASPTSPSTSTATPHSTDNTTLDRQHHTTPIYGTTTNPTSILPTNTCTHDLITVDTQPPGRLGTDHKLLAAGRLDNLSSVYPAITALIDAADAATDILILACFDHEEIGSATTTGAAGPILQDTLERTAYALGLNLDETKRAYQRSTCVSADAAHSIHPNYPTHHDPHNYPQLGHGPVLKINANHRYASTAETQAHWLKHCPESQHFVSNNNTPCGTTIGPITATRLGIPTVDVGIPLLSMHSARELCHLDDITALHKALTNYLVG